MKHLIRDATVGERLCAYFRPPPFTGGFNSVCKTISRKKNFSETTFRVKARRNPLAKLTRDFACGSFFHEIRVVFWKERSRKSTMRDLFVKWKSIPEIEVVDTIQAQNGTHSILCVLRVYPNIFTIKYHKTRKRFRKKL